MNEIEELEKRLDELRKEDNAKRTTFVKINGKSMNVVECRKIGSGGMRYHSQVKDCVYVPAVPLLIVEEKK